MRNPLTHASQPNDYQSTARSIRIGSLGVALEPSPGGTLVVRLRGHQIRSKQAAELAYRLTEAALSCRGRMVVAMDGISRASAVWWRAIKDLSRRCEILGGALTITRLAAGSRVRAPSKAA